MNKEEFAALQQRQQTSGKTLKDFLTASGISQSTCRYWRKKFAFTEEPRELVPISFTDSDHHSSAQSTLSSEMPSGATLVFPNGLRAHFGFGMESVLKDLLEKSLSSHVLS